MAATVEPAQWADTQSSASHSGQCRGLHDWAGRSHFCWSTDPGMWVLRLLHERSTTYAMQFYMLPLCKLVSWTYLWLNAQQQHQQQKHQHQQAKQSASIQKVVDWTRSTAWPLEIADNGPNHTIHHLKLAFGISTSNLSSSVCDGDRPPFEPSNNLASCFIGTQCNKGDLVVDHHTHILGRPSSKPPSLHRVLRTRAGHPNTAANWKEAMPVRHIVRWWVVNCGRHVWPLPFDCATGRSSLCLWPYDLSGADRWLFQDSCH